MKPCHVPVSLSIYERDNVFEVHFRKGIERAQEI
jgi:hypothetical protein